MAWRGSSVPRSIISTARSSSIRSSSSTALPRLRTSPSLQSPCRSVFTIPTAIRALSCTESLMLLHRSTSLARLTSHITVEARACCDLSQGDQWASIKAQIGYLGQLLVWRTRCYI